MFESRAESLEPEAMRALPPDASAAVGPGAGAFDPRDVTPVPVLLVTPQGRIAWMNQPAERLFGRAAVELVGESFVQLLALGARAIHARAILRQHCRGAESFVLELPVRTTRNAEHWVALQVQRMQTSAGRWAYVAVLTDLQAMHQAFDALQRRNAQLVARALQSNAASEMKSEFLTGISNELRTPLGGMLEMTRVLLDSALDREQQTVAELLHHSAKSILSLVDDMVDFAKIESGKMELVALDFDLRLAADAVGASLSADADAIGATFLYRLDHAIPARINGDPGRLRQVLLQIGRACLGAAARQPGTLSLRGDASSETAYGVELGFAFRFDPAEGAVAAVPECFGSLASGDTTGVTARSPVGLSLAIVHHLVALLGGRTRVDVTPGHGWILTLHLPFAKQTAGPAAGMAAAPAEPVDLSDSPVLALFEPDLTWEAIQLSARGFGGRVERAPNAAAAVQAMRTAAQIARGYGAVLVHLEMEGVDAARFARAVRRETTFDAVPLILMTSLGRSGDSALATEWGYSAYLSEPVTPELLRQTLEASIRLRRSTTSTPERLVTRHSLAEESKVRRCVLIVDDNALDHLLLVSALHRMGFSSEVVVHPETVLARLEAGSAQFVVVLYGADRPDPGDLVRRIRASRDEVRNVPVLAIVPADGADPRPAASLDIDAVTEAGSDLGALCSTIERLLIHGTPGRGESATVSPAAERAATPGGEDAVKFRSACVRRFLDGAEAAVKETCSALVDDDPVRGATSVRTLLRDARGIVAPPVVALLERLDQVFIRGDMDMASPLVFEMTQEIARELSALRGDTPAESATSPAGGPA